MGFSMESEFEVTARVTNVTRSKDGLLVEVDKNPLRPAMGGQDEDRGWIVKNSERYSVDRVINKNGVIQLLIKNANATLKVGDIVLINVDQERRRKLSIIHTAQHAFFKALTIVEDDIEFENVFLTVKDGLPYGELIISSQRDLSFEKLTEAEFITNDVIKRDLKVKIYWIAKSELTENIRARDTLLMRVDRLRVVEIDGYDWSACSGTHVKRTGEIYFFKLINVKKLKNRGKQRYKLIFIAGEEALKYALQLGNNLIKASQLFGFRPENLVGYLNNMKNEIQRLEVLKESLFSLLKDEIFRQMESKTNSLLLIEGMSPKDQIRLLKDLRKKVSPDVIFGLMTKINNEIFFTVFGSKDAVNRFLEVVRELEGQIWGKNIYQGRIPLDHYEQLKNRLIGVFGNDIIRTMERKSKR